MMETQLVGKMDVLFVCRNHYFGLVSRGKVKDFYVFRLATCQMVGCASISYRKVLVGDGQAQARQVFIKPDGSLYEEGC